MIKLKKPHLTAFMGYKAGMTHIVRELDKPGSKMHKKDICEAVTILETPPMVGVGIVGYCDTPFGKKTVGTIWAQHLSMHCLRRFYKNWYRSKHKAFSKYARNYNKKHIRQERKEIIQRMIKLCSVVRLIAHTQVHKVNAGTKSAKQKKAHIMEIQVNGGTIEEKVKYALSLFEKLIPIHDVFKKNEMIDAIGITKGHGTEGVVKRYGVTRLPRKTHKGLRKVACIGSWHPSRVSFTVARAGQMGYFHRTHYNRKIYMLGKSLTTEEGKLAGRTEFDLTDKSINPVGGFPHYGMVKEDFVMLKGSVQGTRKRVITLRKTILEKTTRKAKEEIALKFIDTSSKWGHGKFQTLDEKRKFMGPLKKELKKKKRRRLKKIS